jgi:phosphoribosylformylglycinamidine synthase
MSVRIGVVTFPGTLDDQDAIRAVTYSGATAISLWHGDPDLKNVDAVILPGGFSYGDYLRCGAIAKLAPVMKEVIDKANKGMPVLGICNGFQVLCESGLLPGVLTRNEGLHFTCRDEKLQVTNINSAWTNGFKLNQEIIIPIKNGEGCYQVDAKTMSQLESDDQIVFKYINNPNGSLNNIAGVTNKNRNVVGLMPHPEHAIDKLTGPSTDGLNLFNSVITSLVSNLA